MKLLKVLSLFFLSFRVTQAVHGEGEQLLVGADSNVIRREAFSLLLYTQHTQPGEQSRVFPGLANFTCSGNITSILFIAENITVRDTLSITFSLWGPVPNTRTGVFSGGLGDTREVTWQDIELVSQPPHREDVAIYRANFESPLQFRSGDVLGIDQGPSPVGLAIQYAYAWGPENYVSQLQSDSVANVSMFVSSPVAVQDFPLLALENNHCDSCLSMCADGLLSPMDLELFLKVNSNPRVITPFRESPSISPLLRFTDTGSIARWAVNRRMSSASELPELQIWRVEDSNSSSGEIRYQRVNGTSTDFADGDLNFQMNITLINQEISFREGDILAVRSSDRIVLGDLLLNPDDYGSSGYEPGDEKLEIDPTYEQGEIEISLLIDLDSSDGTVNTSELSRSIAEHVIGTPAYNHSNLAFQSDKYAVVPEFTITHSGLLTRWLFAAQLPTTLSLAQEKPQLQVWRRAPNRFRDTFRLVHTTNCSLQQYKKGNSLGTHEYLLEEPARVEAGDILGFYQPANNESRLNLALLRNTETLMNELVLLHTEPFLLAMSNSNGNERILPLMSAEILPDGDSTVTTPTPTQSTPTPTPTQVTTTEESRNLIGRNEIIIMAVVCGAVILTGAVLVVIIVYCYLKQAHRVRIQSKSSVYLTSQKCRSGNKNSTQVHLQSHQTIPYSDLHPKAVEASGNSVHLTEQDTDELATDEGKNGTLKISFD